MDVLPKDIHALLSKVLPKIFTTIGALTSLRDVPIILEYMVHRLAFLEYAIYVWRQRQSPNSQGRPEHSYERWQFLFAERSLYYLFKDILMNCSDRLSGSDDAHSYAKAVPLRHGLGVYELAAAPARAVLRKLLGSWLRILIEHLVVSNTAKHGTWKDVRLLDIPQNKAVGLRSVVAHVDNHAVQLWSLARVCLEILTLTVNDITSSRDATQSHPLPYRTANAMLMHRDWPLDRSIHQSSHVPVRMHNDLLSNTSSLSHWSSTGVHRPSKSNASRTTKALSLAKCLWLLYSNSHLSRTTHSKAGRLLRSGDLQELGLPTAKHESSKGCYVSLRSIKALQIEASISHLWVTIAGAIMDLIEPGNSTACRCERSAYEFALRALLQGLTEAALSSDVFGGRPLPSHRNDGFTMINWLGQPIPINSTKSLQREIVSLRLAIPVIHSQASVFHLPTHFRRTALSRSIVPAHHWAHHLAENYVCALPRRIASGQASIVLSSGTGAPVLHSASFPGSMEIIQFLLNAGADPVHQSARWLDLIHNPESRRSVYAKPPRLDRPVLPSRNSNSIRKDGAGGTIAQIWKNPQAAVIGVIGKDMTDEKLRPCSVTERSSKRSRTKNLRRKADSSETRHGTTDSLSTLSSMLRRLRNTTTISGFWKLRSFLRFLFGMPSRRNFNRLLRPRVPMDHVRLTWICHCGKELYGDFHNGDPSAVARLANLLQKRTRDISRFSTTAMLTTTGHVNQTVMQSSSSSAPSRSSVSSSQTSRASTNQIQPPQPCHLKASGSTSNKPPDIVGMGYSPVPGTTHAPMQKQYIEMCVNTGQHYQRLAEIDVARHKTDAELFRWIRKRYGELRDWRTKWQYFLRPQAMSYVEFALNRKQKVHIYRPKDAYPPKAEIDAGRYMYNMPPPPIPSNTFIHYLRECDLDSYSESQDNEILEVIAKKLDTRVSDQPCLSTKAYGMLVHEGPDVTAILWTMMIIVVVMCGPLVAFIVITKDGQSATGLAATALAVVTLLWMGMQVDRGMNFSD